MGVLWTPEVLGNQLRIWLDPSDSDTLVRSSDGTLVAWLDKSGNNHHFSQHTSSSKCPTIVSAGINGLDTISFDGGDYLRIVSNNNMTTETINYAYIWYKPTSGGTDYQRSFSSGSGGSDITVSGVYAIASTNLGVDAGGPELRSYDYLGAARDAANFFIGRQNWLDIQYYFGQLGEIVITSHLSTTDYEMLQGYLAHKWGTLASLDVVHPYKTVAPTYGQTFSGNVTKLLDGLAGDLVVIRDWVTKQYVTEAIPDANGDWSAEVPTGQFEISYFALNYKPITHGPYTVS